VYGAVLKKPGNTLIYLVPQIAEEGDLCCIVAGMSVPVILRKIGGKDRYKFVGEAFYLENAWRSCGECEKREFKCKKLFSLLKFKIDKLLLVCINNVQTAYISRYAVCCVVGGFLGF
jgi:hypothetical protein